MKKRLEELKNREGGFTLIELMVVVLIIGILVAIAVPKFLTAQNGAKAKSAQANARSAEAVAESVYADKGAWLKVDGAALTSGDASLFPTGTVADTASSKPTEVSWKVYAATPPSSTTDGVSIAVMSSAGDCYLIKNDGGGTNYAKLASVAAGGCKASATATYGPDPATQWG